MVVDGGCMDGWKWYQESLGERGEQQRLLNRKEAEWVADIRSARRTAPTQKGGRRHARARLVR